MSGWNRKQHIPSFQLWENVEYSTWSQVEPLFTSYNANMFSLCWKKHLPKISLNML